MLRSPRRWIATAQTNYSPVIRVLLTAYGFLLARGWSEKAIFAGVTVFACLTAAGLGFTIQRLFF